MMRRVIASEFIKIRRSMIWFLAVLGPLGVVGLQALNYTLRYDYLTRKYASDLWGRLIMDVQFLAVPALLMGITVIASMIAGIEHRTNAWKQTLALPVTRASVFAAKFFVLAFLLLFSSTLLVLGTAALGAALNFGVNPIPYQQLLIRSYFPYLAAMPFVALQTWLSVVVKNQSIPLTVGLLGAVLSPFASVMNDWLPLKWPLLLNEWNEPLYSAAAGIVTGALVYLAGMANFIGKDVK